MVNLAPGGLYTPLVIAGSGVSVTITGVGGACTGAVLFQGPEDFSTPLPPPPPPPPSSQLSPGSSLFSLSSSSFSLLEEVISITETPRKLLVQIYMTQEVT